MERERVAKLLYETWRHVAENGSRWDAMADAVLLLLADARRQAVPQWNGEALTEDTLEHDLEDIIGYGCHLAPKGTRGLVLHESTIRGIIMTLKDKYGLNLLPPAPRREKGTP